MSDEGTRLAEKLPSRQKAHYDKWIESFNIVQMAIDLETKKASRRLQVAENVRRHRERKKLAAT